MTAPVPASIPTGQMHRRHVLLCDDSPEIQDLLREILEGEGYRVSPCPEPLTLTEVRRQQPDLVVLDHMLTEGEGSGWQLLAELRADPDLARLPIVVCTGAVHKVRQEDARLRALNAQVVTKPFDIDDLLGAVERAWTWPAAAAVRKEMERAVC